MKYSEIAFRYRVRLLIKMKMMTYGTLAEILGESKSAVSDKINGSYHFSMENVCRIAEAFDITLDALFSKDMTDVFEMEEKIARMRVCNARKASEKPIPRMRYEDRIMHDIDRYSFMARESSEDFSSYFGD